MTYDEAKVEAFGLHLATKTAGEALEGLPGVGSGPMGLTPDAVKFSPEYRELKAAYERAFARLRRFNAWYTKAFKRELARDREGRRGRPAGA